MTNWQCGLFRVVVVIEDSYGVVSPNQCDLKLCGRSAPLFKDRRVGRLLVEKIVTVIHGVGRNNPLPERDSSYLALDYITEMADLYLASDIVIARSGAVTCVEVDALARFALFIPLPIGNGEQALNAAPIIAKGRARLVNQSEFNSKWLSANLSELLEQSRNAPVVGDNSAIEAADRLATMVEKIGRAQ